MRAAFQYNLKRRPFFRPLQSAGEDLTYSLSQAPHGEELLERVPMVGTLVSG
jgi:predicted heme/steroid binding protein